MYNHNKNELNIFKQQIQQQIQDVQEKINKRLDNIENQLRKRNRNVQIIDPLPIIPQEQKQTKLSSLSIESKPLLFDTNMNSIETLCEDADRLFDEGLYEKGVNILSKYLSSLATTKANIPDNNSIIKAKVERRRLMWRLARLHYFLAIDNNESLGPFSQHAKKHIFRGLDNAERALSIHSSDDAKVNGTQLNNLEIFNIHKWYAILLGLSDRFVGDKERIRNSHLIRKHSLLALELNPTDHEIHHTLGRICFEIAKIPWTMKSMAKVAYGALPEATFEEAKEHFEKVQELKPHWKLNLLYLAKVLIELKDKSKAKSILSNLAQNQSNGNVDSDPDDERVIKDAQRLLKKVDGGWW